MGGACAGVLFGRYTIVLPGCMRCGTWYRQDQSLGRGCEIESVALPRDHFDYKAGVGALCKGNQAPAFTALSMGLDASFVTFCVVLPRR